MNIYNEAASWLVEQHEQGNDFYGACYAIIIGKFRCTPPIDAIKFDALFRPECTSHAFWDEEWGEDKNNCRLLALAFAAAMRDAGDL